MKLTQLIEELFSIYKKHGEQEVKIDLLTENQSNFVKITGVDFFDKHGVSIDGEVGDIKKFKKKFK